ncbi:MAG: sensor histidine kinase [Micrococcales bacterium]
MKYNAGLGRLWDRISLRTKLTTLSVGLIGLLLAVSSVGTISLLRTYLQQNTDTLLSSTASTLQHEDPTLLEARLAAHFVTLPRLPSDYYIAFVDARGQLLIGLVSSASGTSDVPNLTKMTASKVLALQGQPFDTEVVGKKVKSDLGTWRMIALPLTSMSGSVIVALPDASNAALITRYTNIGTSFALLLLALSAIAIWLTITSALRPLREVERTAEKIAEGDTSQRLVEHNAKTEIGRLNSSLNSMLNSIDEAMVARNKTLGRMQQFVADASHELRTPLVSLRGYAELYRIGALEGKQELDDAMARIESEAKRMSELVESLLALARLDEAAPFVKADHDLVEMAQATARDISVAEAGREFVIVGLDGVPLKLNARVDALCDAPAMKQVLTNLMANAARFSKVGGQVEIALGSDANNVILEVRDHGEGIPEALREKVFERFFRADNSRNRETGGNGIGLSIVKTIVDRHGGRISIHETPGGGATFRVTLPL